MIAVPFYTQSLSGIGWGDDVRREVVNRTEPREFQETREPLAAT
jgi:hypothetical protein